MRNGLTIVFRLAVILLLALIALDLHAALTELRGVRSEQVKNIVTKLRVTRPGLRLDEKRQANFASMCSVDVNTISEPLRVTVEQ